MAVWCFEFYANIAVVLLMLINECKNVKFQTVVVLNSNLTHYFQINHPELPHGIQNDRRDWGVTPINSGERNQRACTLSYLTTMDLSRWDMA